ncbi:hypothetical protein RFI_03100, partial [Reticulomyxa filosa]
ANVNNNLILNDNWIKKYVENNKNNEKWLNTMDYSLIYTQQKTTELEDIWKIKKTADAEDKEVEEKEEEEEKEKELEVRYISIHGEAGTGKSIFVQKIAYLCKQMWNDRFELLLQIPLKKIANIFEKEMNKNDYTKCIVNEKNELLLVLDGFDEIENELNTKKPGLKQWLQHCTVNPNYFILMASRPNAICSYLDNKQADMLIKTLNNNPTLHLLSHTPLYLHLFCYLAKQEMKIKIFDKLNNISVSKLYEKILKYYMKWNWIKSNKKN